MIVKLISNSTILRSRELLEQIGLKDGHDVKSPCAGQAWHDYLFFFLSKAESFIKSCT
jgi:hypothetical protein